MLNNTCLRGWLGSEVIGAKMVAFQFQLIQPESPRCGNKKAKYTKLENESPEKVVVVSSSNTLCVECDENAL